MCSTRLRINKSYFILSQFLKSYFNSGNLTEIYSLPEHHHHHHLLLLLLLLQPFRDSATGPILLQFIFLSVFYHQYIYISVTFSKFFNLPFVLNIISFILFSSTFYCKYFNWLHILYIGSLFYLIRYVMMISKLAFFCRFYLNIYDFLQLIPRKRTL